MSEAFTAFDCGASDRQICVHSDDGRFGCAGDEIVVGQTLRISEASGKSHEEAERNAAEEREILALSATSPKMRHIGSLTFSLEGHELQHFRWRWLGDRSAGVG